MEGDAFLDDLRRWVADAVADEAGASRFRARVLRQQAEEEATVAGLALDLAERAADVVVALGGGAAVAGRIVAVGADFLAVRERRELPTFVPLRAVGVLRLAPGTSAGDPTGDRPPPLAASLLAVLGGVAAGRPRVQLSTTAGPLTGRLRAVGADVIALLADGEPATDAYVPVRSLLALTLLDVR